MTDLLADQQPKKKLEIFEDEKNEGATKVDGLSQVHVKDEHEAFSMFLKGDSRKDRNVRLEKYHQRHLLKIFLLS